jgi:hypothetical protein
VVFGVHTGGLSVRSTVGIIVPRAVPSGDRQAAMSSAEPAGIAAG